MMIRFVPAALKETHGSAYLIRFLFGGVTTVLAAAIAHWWGPVVGGLFLAFPAIFPASATLVEKHERRKKEKHGQDGRKRGREAAALDSSGAVLGAVGLAGFGGAVWALAGRLEPWVALPAATAVWAAVSILLWKLRRSL